MNEYHELMVAGGRGYNNEPVICQALLAANLALDNTFGVKPMRLHHGGAKGADTLAAQVATMLGWQVVEYEAEWDAFGRAAGPLRNQRMVDWSNAVLLVSFPGGTGTADCIDRAVKAGIPHYEVKPGVDLTNAELEGTIARVSNG